MVKKYTPTGKEKDAHGKVSDIWAKNIELCEELIVYEVIDNENGTINVKGLLTVYTSFGDFQSHVELDLQQEGGRHSSKG